MTRVLYGWKNRRHRALILSGLYAVAFIGYWGWLMPTLLGL